MRNARTQPPIQTRRRRPKRRPLTLVVALLGLGVMAIGLFNVSGAEAVIKQRTKLTISERFPAFHGKVSSPADHCED